MTPLITAETGSRELQTSSVMLGPECLYCHSYATASFLGGKDMCRCGRTQLIRNGTVRIALITATDAGREG